MSPPLEVLVEEDETRLRDEVGGCETAELLQQFENFWKDQLDFSGIYSTIFSGKQLTIIFNYL